MPSVRRSGQRACREALDLIKLKRRNGVAIALGALVLFAGCGGGSTSSVTKQPGSGVLKRPRIADMRQRRALDKGRKADAEKSPKARPGARPKPRRLNAPHQRPDGSSDGSTRRVVERLLSGGGSHRKKGSSRTVPREVVQGILNGQGEGGQSEGGPGPSPQRILKEITASSR